MEKNIKRRQKKTYGHNQKITYCDRNGDFATTCKEIEKRKDYDDKIRDVMGKTIRHADDIRYQKINFVRTSPENE